MMMDNKAHVRDAKDDEEMMLPRIPWSQIEDRHGESGLEHLFLYDKDNTSWIKIWEGHSFSMIL
jgi:hypothetical protein